MRKALLNRKFVLGLAVWMSLIAIPPSNAFAMPTASVTAFDITSLRQIQMNSILSELSRPEARAHMMLMGVSQKDLKEKLTQLDDNQLAYVAEKTAAVKVAGDAGLGLIITLLVIAILVVIFSRLANHQRIN